MSYTNKSFDCEDVEYKPFHEEVGNYSFNNRTVRYGETVYYTNNTLTEEKKYRYFDVQRLLCCYVRMRHRSSLGGAGLLYITKNSITVSTSALVLK